MLIGLNQQGFMQLTLKLLFKRQAFLFQQN